MPKKGKNRKNSKSRGKQEKPTEATIQEAIPVQKPYVEPVGGQLEDYVSTEVDVRMQNFPYIGARGMGTIWEQEFGEAKSSHLRPLNLEIVIQQNPPSPCITSVEPEEANSNVSFQTDKKDLPSISEKVKEDPKKGSNKYCFFHVLFIIIVVFIMFLIKYFKVKN